MVANPPSVPKERGQWFIPSTYAEHDARSHDAQRAQGAFRWLTLDVDENNLDLSEIDAALSEVIGDVARLIYSSRGATESGRKWRALVPLKSEVAGAEFAEVQNAFFDLLEHERVCAYHQGIYRADGSLYGWELLGRSTHPELTEGPGQLFSLANALNAEVRLSRLLRRHCFEAAERGGLRQPLFFNNHPAECEDFDALLSELSELRSLYPKLRLVFEVHEAAVTDLGVMASVRESLRRMNIDLAYDDFGAGQARLLELIEVPPDYLKFDISLIRGLDGRDSPKYRLLATLNGLISDLGIRTLAEGIESELGARLCREIGIDLLQGFYFSRPGLVRRQSHHHNETDSAP